MLYFAYGSNMSGRRLRARIGESSFLGKARLQGYQLRFHKIGRDQSGKCDAYHTGNETDRMFGAVYLIDKDQLRRLDRYEGAGKGYLRQEIGIFDLTGTAFQAFTYIATRIDQGLKPFHWYKFHVMQGALEIQLPEYYVAQINRIDVTQDADLRRTRKELQIYTLL